MLLSLIEKGLEVLKPLAKSWFPDDEAKQKQFLDAQRVFFEGYFKAASSSDKNQADIFIKTMDKKPTTFHTGWRPTVAWCCVAGLFYSALLVPLLLSFGVSAVPADTEVLQTILIGMLGLAGVRSFDKFKGTAR